ncbi:MAG: flagellar hook protein FlgE [Acidimicrobiia bacterium]|nr:flagellar hook protein FlgE [Acidimicrobiia bacterium]MDH5290491.1 flagellar hook protein FlgE [Acidimicrobiia bacterium]
MIRSMYAAVSGLRSHQTMMDVVGNNIANVNTTGFKRSEALFQDVLSQTIHGAGTPTTALGGTNPAQVGLGVMVSAIAQNLSQGSLQVTNRDLDLAIQGDGFFVVDQGGEQMFTRAGSFFLDANGRLVNSDGGLIQGWNADTAGRVDSGGAPGTIRIPIGEQSAPAATSDVKLGGNLSADAAVGTQYFTGLSVFDEQGNPIDIDLTIEKTNDDEWTVSATYGPTQIPIVLADNVLTFGANGELTSPADLQIDIAAGGIPGLGAVTFTIGGASERRITQYGGASSVAPVTQDGSAAGMLQSLRVGTDGVIVGAYSNGLVKPIGQVAMAAFSNPEGLERITGSNWRVTTNSGLAQIGTAASGGRGSVAPGTLEMSNVDLAEEFTALIRAQRGFQANSRVVTSSDELLQEIVALKR